MVDPGKLALALPDVVSGIACAGTALESRTYQTAKKSFLFVSKTQARLKLGDSAAEAGKLGYTVGSSGWVTLPLDGLPAASLMKRWIAESHALFAKPGGKTAKKAGKKRRQA